MTDFRFDEDAFLSEAFDYIQSTYGQHYAHEINGRNVQVIDLWEGMGSLQTTSRDTALKYLVRLGRKEGFNIKDAYKAIHYICLMVYAARASEDAMVEKAHAKVAESVSDRKVFHIDVPDSILKDIKQKFETKRYLPEGSIDLSAPYSFSSAIITPDPDAEETIPYNSSEPYLIKGDGSTKKESDQEVKQKMVRDPVTGRFVTALRPDQKPVEDRKSLDEVFQEMFGANLHHFKNISERY